jgi:hypothetical protein
MLKKALALSVLPLVLLSGAAFQSDNSVPGQLAKIQSEISDLKAQVATVAANNKGPRKFYLTKNQYVGSQALTACAAGYHMAALWEIHEPALLRYDTELGATEDDSGFGPPAIPGWIRTGNLSSSGPGPGRSNCKAWTSAGGLDAGSTLQLDLGWEFDARAISPWQGSPQMCSLPHAVWCVQD